MYQTCMTFNTQVGMICDLPLKRRAVHGKNEQLLANSCTSNFNCSELYLQCTGQWDCTVRWYLVAGQVSLVLYGCYGLASFYSSVFQKVILRESSL